jgi:YesN/AraC family two-component response regulator
MKKAQKEPTTKANRSEAKDVKNLVSTFPQLEINKALIIKESNAHCYILCALKSTHNAMSGDTTWSKQVFTKTEEVWNSLPDSDKTAKNMASAQKMVILHDPTIEPIEDDSSSRSSIDPIPLSKEQIEDIKELSSNDLSLKDIAKQLSLRQKDVEPHL